jgi:hypothetical protein
MSALNVPAFDLQAPRLIHFAHKAAIGERLDLQRLEVDGFHAPPAKPVRLGAITMATGYPVVTWTLLQQWAIDERSARGSQRVQTFFIETTGSREVDVTAYVELQVKDGIDALTEAAMCDAFAAYKYPDSGDLDSYIEERLRALAEVSPYAFKLNVFYDVSMVSDLKIDDQSLQCIKRRLGENFKLHLVKQSELSVLRPVVPHPNATSSANSDVAVKKVADRNSEGMGCDGLHTKSKEFAKLDILPQTRTTWGWHRRRIGCAVLDLYYPVTEFRDQELVASVYWTYSEPLDQYIIDMVQRCANDAAVSSVVALIVFTDLTTALASFKALFWKCLHEKLNQALSCVDVGLVVNSLPKGNWH